MYRDGHHLFHTKRDWQSRPEARRIRETPELIVRMDRERHNELHSKCPAVPLLGYHALVRVNSDFEPVPGDTLATIDNVLLAMDKASKHPKAHYIERASTALSIWALELQLPHVREALKDD